MREVAQRLRVCAATVYKLCAAGELVHVPISNAIRLAPSDLAHLKAVHRAKVMLAAEELVRPFGIGQITF